jgi:hypothetical protein
MNNETIGLLFFVEVSHHGASAIHREWFYPSRGSAVAQRLGDQRRVTRARRSSYSNGKQFNKNISLHMPRVSEKSKQFNKNISLHMSCVSEKSGKRLLRIAS